jgi:tRNA dimethylallyltransferase
MPEEMQGVKHYLIDELLPEEEFNIVRFQSMAKAALDEIYSKGQIPIIAGGTGFYIQALLYDIDFNQQDADEEYRNELEAYAIEFGNEALHRKLKEIDPVSAEKIHANNVKRVIRALEYFKLTGKPISEHNEAESEKESPYNFAYFVLTDDRANLYQRIEKRVDIMMEQGLLEEVKKLKAMGYHRSMVSMQGLGYKEILDYLDNKCSLDEAVATIKLETRHFAKRQLTWFRREREVIWMDKSQFDYNENLVLDEMCRILNAKGII